MLKGTCVTCQLRAQRAHYRTHFPNTKHNRSQKAPTRQLGIQHARLRTKCLIPSIIDRTNRITCKLRAQRVRQPLVPRLGAVLGHEARGVGQQRCVV